MRGGLRPSPAGPLPLLWVALISVNLIAFSSASGNLTTSHRMLKIPIGKSVFLQPEDLTVLTPGNGPCRIRVTEGEPIWTRVGKISPQVFDCRFKQNVVCYSHNGSPLLEEDRIQFTVYYFDEAGGTQHKTVTMTVKILANQSLETVALGPQIDHVTLLDNSSLSEPINASLVRFRYNYQEGASCVVSYREPSRSLPFPIAGVIEGTDHQTISNFSMDCRDFLMENFRYRHSGSRSPNMDYVPIAVEVEDPREERGWIVRERLFLEVLLGTKTEPNEPPRISVNRTSVLRVQQFVVYALDSDVLLATDNETSANNLVFEIVTDLDREEEGFFANLQKNTRRVRSFYLEDLVNRNIAYHPPTKVLNEEKEIEVEFIVWDEHCFASEPARLRVLVVPTKTNSPRLAFNDGLVVQEGGSCTITADDLQIVDQDNLQNVEVHVKGGLRHGRLEINGRPGAVFTVRDIESKLVVYRHDHTDTTEDRIIVRITDGRHGMRARIPITILPVNDNSPYLLIQEALDVQTGGYAQITNRNLNATDKDGKDQRISYVVKSSSKAGKIVKRRLNLTRGVPVTRFTQDEVDAGLIYYHNFGGDSIADTLEFRLMDENDPPNKSGKYTLEVRIRPSNNLPPNLVEGATKILTVNETELGILRKEILWYEDVEFPSDNVVYTITSQPHYPTTPLTLDAGRFISIDNGTRKRDMMAVESAPALRTFTQQAVDEGRVAYIPPMEDIGLINRTAWMVFAVSDRFGNSIIEQMLEIVILPVDNQEPRALVKSLKVKKGGLMRLTADVILVSDRGTNPKDLTFILDLKPKYGELLKDGLAIVVGDRFTFDDLNKSDIRYVHSGSESAEDSFQLSVSDGLHIFSTSFSIEVQHNTNQRPQPITDLNNRLEVEEGGMVFIGPENLAATDNDTDSNLINFLIMKSPEFGEIRLAGTKAEQFSQSDIISSRVTYVHTGGEVGRRLLVDSITFTVLDQSPPLPAAETVPLIDLEVTILPLDNSPPELIVGGPVVVVEGKPASITPEIVSARDVDSPTETLLFIVAQTPMWGFLERSKSNTRSGRSQTSRRISSFTLSDLTEGTIQYVPSNLSKGGPPSDSFFIYVTDGQNQSPLSQVEIAVLPPNIKLPDFEIGNILVDEGGEREFRIQLSGGASQLEDTDELLLSVASQPLHGELILVRTAQQPGGFKELRFHDVSFADIEAGIQMVYRHDGSESKEDRFTLSLSDGTHVVKRTSVVTVVPVNDLKPELVRNIPLPVDFGGTKLISTSILKATDDDTASSQISFVLVTTPNKGVLETETTIQDKVSTAGPTAGMWIQLEVGDNFTQSSIDESRVRYVHTTELDRETANDKFLFRVTDGVNFLPSAAFLVDIYLSNPKRIILRNRGISLEEGNVAVITADLLSADDGGRQPKDLVFSVDRNPFRGFLEFIDQDGKNSTVSRFTQEDILARRLVYRNRDPGTSDSFVVTVTGSRNIPSTSATVKIEIRPVIRSLPVLLANVPLTVMQGGSATIGSAHLFVASEEEDVTSFNLTYILVERPKNGDLLLRGHSVHRSFTQLDVEAGDVIYQSDDSDDYMTDYFLFNITDGRYEGAYLVNGTIQTKPAFFNILIQPIVRDFPRIIRNRMPESLQTLGSTGKLGFVISSDYLKVSHPTHDSGEIWYILRDSPSEGQLEYVDTERPIRRKFTQKDIDDEKVVFLLKENPSAANDSFTFRIEDRNRKGPDETFRFVLQWAIVELAHNQYTVCEDSGSVSIKIVRRGLTTNRVGANIRAKQLSAKQGDDFIPRSDGGALVFEPGVTELFWTIEIVNDHLEDEPKEKFKVLLRNANQAVLGDTTKAVVQLVNVERGRCAFDESSPSRRFPSREREATTPLDRHEFQDSYDDQAFDGFGEEVDEDYSDNPRPYVNSDHSSRVKGSRNQKQSKPRDTATSRRKWKDEEDGEEDYDDDVIRVDGKLGYRKRSQLEGFKAKKKAKAEHPLQKYRKGERDRGNRDGKGKKKQQLLFDDDLRREHGRRKEPITTTIATTTTTLEIPGAFVPQECTRDTKGLLYFDLLSSKMHRCNGQRWEPWGWGAGDGYQYTALLKDAAGSEQDEEDSSPPAPPPPAPLPPSSNPGRPSSTTDESSSKTKSHKKTCRSGWSLYRNSCYRLGADRTSWNDAEFVCMRDGGHLTDVQSKDHLRWLSQIARGSNFWIGLNDKQSSGVWRYTSGSPSAIFFNWRRAYPRLNGRYSNCVMVRKNLEWMNKACDVGRANFICTQPQAQRTHKQPYLRLINQ